MSPTTTRLTIRPMTEQEGADALVQARLAYEDELVRAGAYPQDAAHRKAEADWVRYPADSAPYVIEADGRRVGMMLLGMREKYGSMFGYVYGIFIDPEARGRGYGREAVRLAEEHLARRGAKEIQLRVWGDNHAALRLFEQLGFKMTSLLMRKVLP